MFVPEFTITNKILKNITQVEYSKALIENPPILSSWEKQLQKEARIRAVHSSLIQIGLNLPPDYIKKFLEGLADKINIEVMKINQALDYTDDELKNLDLHEQDINKLYRIVLSESSVMGYRKRKIDGYTNPEEILSEMVQLMDWYNSLDARETHPLLVAGIIKARIEQIWPFEQKNTVISDLTARAILNTNGFEINRYYCLEEYYARSAQVYKSKLSTISRDEGELTEWLEYFTEGLALEITNIKEKVLLLSRDTKVAKASGRIKLTLRQERIVEYLQDYGLLQNRDFSRVFPNISEDSVLRDLKVLMKKGIVVKTGSTKSSQYELA